MVGRRLGDIDGEVKHRDIRRAVRPTALTVPAEIHEKYTKSDQRGYKEGEDNGPDNGRGVRGGGQVGVDEVSKLGVGNGFIRIFSESGEVGTEFTKLAIKVGGGVKETGREVLGGKVPGKNDGVEGDAAVAVGGNSGIDKFDRTEGRKVDVGEVDKLFLEVGAIGALDLGEKRFRRVH